MIKNAQSSNVQPHPSAINRRQRPSALSAPRHPALMGAGSPLLTLPVEPEKSGRQRPVSERNYDIYERELLAVLKALKHWCPHLAATEIPVTVLMDLVNLTFWKNLQNINRRVARWFAFLQDYNLVIKHVLGKLHAAVDMLSHPLV